jgi:energy-coupling factor transporter ATP-binding protein EcfA2
VNNRVTFEFEQAGASRATVKAIEAGKLIEVDSFNLDSRKSRAGFLKSVSEKTGIDTESLDEIFLERLDRSKAEARQAAPDNDPLGDCPANIKEQALDMLNSPDLFDIINADIEKIGIAGEKDLCRQLYLIMSSRNLKKPLSGIVFGASASGKSYLIESIANMMPPEAVLQAHDITDEALYYLEPGALKNRIVIAGERIEDKRSRRGKAEDNTKALREILASGKLSKLVTTKDKDGKPITSHIEQFGPIVYLESTTSTGIHDEDATRLLPLVTDESPGQTAVIIEAMKAKALGETAADNQKEEILLKHQTAQRLLRPAKVTIPFVDLLTLPYDVVSTRRAFSQLISMIEAVAILRQYQKETQEQDSDLILCADEIDYGIVYPLVMKIFARTYSGINEKSRDLLRIIIERSPHYSFTILELHGWAGISDASVRRRLRELVEQGIVLESRDIKPYTYKIENPELADTANVNLPDPETIAERLAIMGA